MTPAESFSSRANNTLVNTLLMGEILREAAGAAAVHDIHNVRD